MILIMLILSFVLAMAASPGFGRKFLNGTPQLPKLAVETAGTKQASKPKKKTADKFRLLMANIKMSGIGIVGLSGKIGGTVFNNGKTSRNWVKPKNVRNALTTLVRGILAGVSSSFRGLTAAQVTAWNEAASSDNANSVRRNSFGDIVSLNAIQFFQRINNILLQVAGGTVQDPPVSASSDAITALTLVGDDSAQTLVLNPTLFGGGVVLPAITYMRVFATPQRSNGRQAINPSSLRFLGVFQPGDSIVNMALGAMYIAKFGPLVEGQKITVACDLITTDATSFAKTGLSYVTTNVVA